MLPEWLHSGAILAVPVLGDFRHKPVVSCIHKATTGDSVTHHCDRVSVWLQPCRSSQNRNPSLIKHVYVAQPHLQGPHSKWFWRCAHMDHHSGSGVVKQEVHCKPHNSDGTCAGCGSTLPRCQQRLRGAAQWRTCTAGPVP